MAEAPDILGAIQKGQSLYQQGLESGALAMEARKQAEVSQLERDVAQGGETKTSALQRLSALDPAYAQQIQNRDLEMQGRLAQGVLQASEEDRPAAYQSALEQAAQSGLDVGAMPAAYQPGMESALGGMVAQARQVEAMAGEAEGARLAREKIEAQSALQSQRDAAAANRLRLQERLREQALMREQMAQDKAAEREMQKLEKLMGVPKGASGWAGGENVVMKGMQTGLAGDKMGMRQLIADDRRAYIADKKNMGEVLSGERIKKNNVLKARAAMKNFETGAGAGTRARMAKMSAMLGGDPKAAAAAENLVALGDSMALGEKKPGSGPMTDNDFMVLQGTVLSINNTPERNKMFLDAYEAAADDQIEYSRFKEEFFKRHKNIDMAESAWQQYQDDNPIFSKVEGEDIELNKDRMGWKEYFDKQSEQQMAPETMPAAPVAAAPVPAAVPTREEVSDAQVLAALGLG